MMAIVRETKSASCRKFPLHIRTSPLLRSFPQNSSQTLDTLHACPNRAHSYTPLPPNPSHCLDTRVPWKPQLSSVPVGGGEGVSGEGPQSLGRWHGVKDLDKFFTRIYYYYVNKGFVPIVLKRFLNVLYVGWLGSPLCVCLACSGCAWYACMRTVLFAIANRGRVAPAPIRAKKCGGRANDPISQSQAPANPRPTRGGGRSCLSLESESGYMETRQLTFGACPRVSCLFAWSQRQGTRRPTS